jgi:hypothetical protein
LWKASTAAAEIEDKRTRNAVPKGVSQSLRQAGSFIPYSGVETKEACNEDDNYHYADDIENVHGVLRSRYVPISI